MLRLHSDLLCNENFILNIKKLKLAKQVHSVYIVYKVYIHYLDEEHLS